MKKGSVVRALVTAQGLKTGAFYDVIDVRRTPSLRGTIVDYQLELVRGADPAIWVGNGHLLLEEASLEEASLEDEDEDGPRATAKGVNGDRVSAHACAPGVDLGHCGTCGERLPTYRVVLSRHDAPTKEVSGLSLANARMIARAFIDACDDGGATAISREEV